MFRGRNSFHRSSDSFWVRSHCGSCPSLPPWAGAVPVLSLCLHIPWAQNPSRPVPATPALPTEGLQPLSGKGTAQDTGTHRPPGQPSGAGQGPAPGRHRGPGWVYAMTFLMTLPGVTREVEGRKLGATAIERKGNAATVGTAFSARGRRKGEGARGAGRRQHRQLRAWRVVSKRQTVSDIAYNICSHHVLHWRRRISPRSVADPRKKRPF